MIYLLSGFQDVAITKLMLDCMGIVLESDCLTFRNFLKNLMFIPPEMAMDKFLPISDNNEIIFTCHTTNMSEKLMLTEIEKHEKRKHRWLPRSF